MGELNGSPEGRLRYLPSFLHYDEEEEEEEETYTQTLSAQEQRARCKCQQAMRFARARAPTHLIGKRTTRNDGAGRNLERKMGNVRLRREEFCPEGRGDNARQAFPQWNRLVMELI